MPSSTKKEEETTTAPINLQKKRDKQTEKICDEIMRVGNVVRAKYPFLERHQDAIGLTLMLSCSFIACFAAYCTIFNLYTPYWVNFLVMTLATSIIHEVEHDTIHNLYFNGSIVNDMMLGLAWIMRFNTINPWTRRKFHLHHHKASGTESDIEETGITNGQVWGLRRLFMLLDAGVSFWLRPLSMVQTSKKYRQAHPHIKTPLQKFGVFIENSLAYFPFGFAHYFMLYTFIAFHGLNWYHQNPNAASEIMPQELLQFLPYFSQYLWSFGFPNAFRHFCLIVVSSNMHYYGDIEAGEIIKQTQVWHTWWTLPLDLFTFNFGSTHGIHHFVVRDTFYIRQLMAPSLYGFLQKNGVRFNDFDCVFRANRYSETYREWHLF